MIKRCIKILVAIFLSLMFTISLGKLVICLWDDYYAVNYGYTSSKADIDEWLEQNNLADYKQLFRDKGKTK